jgi:tellurite resistance protein
LRTKLPSIGIVVGALAYCGADSQDEALQAFDTSVAELGFAQIEMPIKTDCSVGLIERALQELSLLKFTEKEKLLKACVTCVTHDGKITTNEAETIRAIGDLLDCPIPMY